MPTSVKTNFTVTRRGYDRTEVDQRLHEVTTRLREAERTRDIERGRATALETQLQQYWSRLEYAEARAAEARASRVPEATATVTDRDGFGARAEKVLGLAEQLAADLRTQARQDAKELLEKAHAEMDAHRRTVERDLNARRAVHEQEVAHRIAELQQREQDITAEMNTARREGEEIRAHARREADQQEMQAQDAVDRLRAAADKAVGEQRAEAHQELARLHDLHTDVHTELARLRGVLANELDNASGYVAANNVPVSAAWPLALDPAADHTTHAQRTEISPGAETSSSGPSN